MSKALEKFLRKRNAAKKNVAKFLDVYERNQSELAFYTEHGQFPREPLALNDDIERAPWEIIDSELVIPLKHLERQIEEIFIRQGVLDKNKLKQCIEYGLIHDAIELHRQKLAPQRYGRELVRCVSPDSVFNLAVAVLLEQADKAAKFFEFFKTGYPLGWINRSSSHMTDFMILLYATYSGESLDCIVDNFAYQHIINDWDTQDTDKITAYITQLCDDQVAQVAAPPSKCFFEFDNSNWQFIPYPALMLLKLRVSRGLVNPEIKHAGFGNITQISPIQVSTDELDEIFVRFQAKLKQQGFDMKAVFS